MCGIIGIVTSPLGIASPNTPNVVPAIIDGLKRLEYRGYDSAGIAVIQDKCIRDRRAVGKLVNLEAALARPGNGQGPNFTPLSGTVGVGHTRWATHGEPSVVNAHPHSTDMLAVVHNGIIENHQALKDDLLALGHTFTSQTDTEVIAHLLTHHRRQGLSMEATLVKVLPTLKGAFALAIIDVETPDRVYFAREGSPMVIGVGSAEGSEGVAPSQTKTNYIASDAIALAPFTPHVIYPQEGDWGYLTSTSVHLFDAKGQPVTRELHTLNLSAHAASKGEYRHFMEKEIHEQPTVVQATLGHYLNAAATGLNPLVHQHLLATLPEVNKLQRLSIVACGTSFYAGLVGKYWMESLLGIPVDVEIASEFRYRHPATGSGETHACLFISQSGETIDTLAALRHVKQWHPKNGEGGAPKTIAMVNVMHSAIAREADFLWPTLAGPEIGVASTKAFTCQLMALACLTLHLAQARGVLIDPLLADVSHSAKAHPYPTAKVITPYIAALKTCPGVLQPSSALRTACVDGAMMIHNHRSVLYLGRGNCYPIALEGALKLKELSYIHAEGYAAGELKHGPIALIEEGTPVVMLLPDDASLEKNFSNMQEVLARGAKVLVLCGERTLPRLSTIPSARGHDAGTKQIFTLQVRGASLDPSSLDEPYTEGGPMLTPCAFVHPFIMTLPLQLLAYEAAILKGTDVDQPRNLAKSVTVE